MTLPVSDVQCKKMPIGQASQKQKTSKGIALQDVSIVKNETYIGVIK